MRFNKVSVWDHYFFWIRRNYFPSWLLYQLLNTRYQAKTPPPHHTHWELPKCLSQVLSEEGSTQNMNPQEGMNTARGHFLSLSSRSTRVGPPSLSTVTDRTSPSLRVFCSCFMMSQRYNEEVLPSTQIKMSPLSFHKAFLSSCCASEKQILYHFQQQVLQTMSDKNLLVASF